MSETLIYLDEERAAALKAAVVAGDADCLQAAVESAIDHWLEEQAVLQVSDEALQQLADEGWNSRDAGLATLGMWAGLTLARRAIRRRQSTQIVETNLPPSTSE